MNRFSPLFYAAICQSILFVATLTPTTLMGTSTAAATSPAPAQHRDIDTQVKSPAARPFLDQAKKAYRAGNSQLAMILLRKAVSAAPKDGLVRVILARLLMQMDHSGAAEQEVRQARRDGAPDELVLPTLLQAMLAQHEELALLNEFPDPPASAPVAADILKGRAQALAALARNDEAAAAMDRSLSLRRDVPGLLVRAQIATQQGNPTLASKLTDEAFKLDPKNGHAMKAKVDMLMAINDYTAALVVNEQMIGEYPNDIGTRLTRIEILQRLKQDDKAEAAMQAVIAMAPGSGVARYFQAVILAKTDNRAAWRIAQTLSPEFTRSNPSIALQTAQMAIESGYVETGTSILAAALTKWPDALDLRFRLASVRLDQNNPDAALMLLTPVKDSNDPKVIDLLVQAYLKSGKDEEALALLDRMQTKNPKDAVEHLTRAHSMRPSNGEITFHLVRALDASGSRDSAKDLLKSLLASHINFVDLPVAHQLAADWHLSG